MKRLKNGELLIVFPEGRRSETGELLAVKRGIGMIAHLSRAAIVPTLITGTEKALPVGARWLKRAKISVVFDKPIYYTSTGEQEDDSDHVLHEKISNKIMEAIKELKNHYANDAIAGK